MQNALNTADHFFTVTETDLATRHTRIFEAGGLAYVLDLGRFIGEVDRPGVRHVETDRDMVAFEVPVSLWHEVGGQVYELV